IRRGGGLAGGTAVVVKVCKPNQDLRFDIPATGVQTIKTMHESGARVLAIEAGRAVVFDRKEMIEFANRFKIAIVALKEQGQI
ncbi:MAG: LpxI family protein, partial [Deltaproteobacteria bacterium]|nr:LpxI family protein [Deltaproteobacteria bacterium]